MERPHKLRCQICGKVYTRLVSGGEVRITTHASGGIKPCVCFKVCDECRKLIMGNIEILMLEDDDR